MGATVSRCAYKGLVYYPGSKHVPGPSAGTLHVGEVIHSFHVLPPGCKIGTQPDDFYWWAQVEFIPWMDDHLVVGMGGYVHRPGRLPLASTPNYQGRVYICRILPENRTAYSLLKRSESSALPNASVHPGGNCVAHAGRGQFVMDFLSMDNRRTLDKPADRNSSYKKGTFAPNGLSIAIIAKCSQVIELIVCRLDFGRMIIESSQINCHRYCQGFRGEESRLDLYECRYSIDSHYIAMGASHGRLFVVDTKMHLVCCVCPGIIDRALDRMSNERCFDFDPRYLHRRLAVANEANAVYLCDLEERSVVEKRQVIDEDDGNLECLKYSHSGHVLSVACSNGYILILDPDTANSLLSLNGPALPSNVALCRVNGALARPLFMSFDTFGQRLAVSYTDGLVRVWQLQPVMNLQFMCKRVILQFVHLRDLDRLPLPNKIKGEIYPLDPMS